MQQGIWASCKGKNLQATTKGMHASQVGSFVAHAAWVTAAAWAAVGDRLLLATGCSEGSLRLYAARKSTLASLPDLLTGAAQEGQPQPLMRLMAAVVAPDLRGVACLDLQACAQPGTGAGCCCPVTGCLPHS